MLKGIQNYHLGAKQFIPSYSKCFILQGPKKGFLGEIGSQIAGMESGVRENGPRIIVFQVNTKNE